MNVLGGNDIIIPSNNKSRMSVATMLHILCREIRALRGETEDKPDLQCIMSMFNTDQNKCNKSLSSTKSARKGEVDQLNRQIQVLKSILIKN